MKEKDKEYEIKCKSCGTKMIIKNPVSNFINKTCRCGAIIQLNIDDRDPE